MHVKSDLKYILMEKSKVTVSKYDMRKICEYHNTLLFLESYGQKTAFIK